MIGGPRLSAVAGAGERAMGWRRWFGPAGGLLWAGGAGLHWHKRAEAAIKRGAGRLLAAGPQTKTGQNGEG
jgi:hypothetical protein